MCIESSYAYSLPALLHPSYPTLAPDELSSIAGASVGQEQQDEAASSDGAESRQHEKDHSGPFGFSSSRALTNSLVLRFSAP